MNDIGLKTRKDALIGLITGVRRCTPRIIAAHDPGSSRIVGCPASAAQKITTLTS